MSSGVIGRAAEFRAIDDFFKSATARRTALVIEGEAGTYLGFVQHVLGHIGWVAVQRG